MDRYPFTDEEEARYWAARRQELLDQMEQDENRLKERLSEVYATEEAKLRQEIASFYAKYGKDGVIEYRNLLAALSDDDRRLLMEKMDEFAKKYPEYAHLMPIREAIYKLDRLEGLQYSIWVQQLEIGAIEDQEFRAHLESYAQQSANLAAEQMGFGTNFYAINSEVITETVGAAWAQGLDFSSRIWSNREALAALLIDDMAKGYARGLKYEEMATMLTDRFDDVSKRNAMRLVYTEGTFVFNEAQARVHEQTFDFYQLDTITDPKTCDICKGVERMQQKEPMPFKDRQPGVNFPPLHPWCRCGYLVVVKDWDDWIEREVARNGGDYIQERDRPDLNYLHYENLVYEKLHDAFIGADDERDLKAHIALAQAGHSVRVLAEDAPDGYSNIDLEMDGELWEIKSPVGGNIRAIESNLRKAKRQFEKHYPNPIGDARVVLSLIAYSGDEADAIKRAREEKKRHGLGMVLVILRDGTVKEL